MAEKVKGKEAEVKQPTEQPPAEAPPEAETKTFTQEEVDALLVEKDKAYQGIQRVVSKKVEEIEGLRTQATESTGGVDTSALEFMLKDKRLQSQYGDADPMIPVLEAEITKRKNIATQKQQYQSWHTWKTTEKGKRRQLITDAGENPDDEKFDRVWDAFNIGVNSAEGDLSEADKRVARILGTGTPKAGAKPEDEEKRISDLVDVELLARLKKTPGFKTHEGVPSGSTGTFNIADLEGKDLTSLTKKEREGYLKAFSDGAVNIK